MEADVLIGGGIRYSVRMGKYSGLVVIAALMLTGCASSEPEAAPSSSASPTATASETAEARVQSRSIEVSPETPEPEATEVANAEAEYLKFVKPTWRTELPADDELLALAATACEYLRAGDQPYDLQIITGGTSENDAWHSMQVGVAAVSTLCTDADPQL